MDGYLRQSTASQVRAIGPFVDSTDFSTAETALSIANTDIKILKNGGASASKNSGGGTHDVNGMYAVTWDATDTATVGELKYSVKVAGALQVFGSYVVLEEEVYDDLFAASAVGYLKPTTAGRDLDVSAGGEAGVDWANVGSPTTSLALTGTTIATTQKVDLETIKTNPVVNAGTVTFPTTATLASTTNITAGTITTVSAVTGLTAANLDATISSRATPAQVNTEADTALVDVGLTTTITGRIDAAITTRASATNLATAQTSLDDIPTNAELATSQAAADDATLSAIAALNNLSSAQAQTAAAAALTAYDPPTNAEMEARTLTAALIAKLTAHLGGVLTVLVGSGSTTTSLVLNASTGINAGVPSAVNDHYNGRVLVFLTGTLAGQATSVSDYVGSTVTMTVVATTSAASAGDTAILI